MGYYSEQFKLDTNLKPFELMTDDETESWFFGAKKNWEDGDPKELFLGIER